MTTGAGSAYTVWKFWAEIVFYIIMVVGMVWSGLSNRSKAKRKDMDDLKTKVDKFDHRITGLEKNEEALTCIGNRVTKIETDSISKHDLATVYDRVNAVASKVDNISGTVDSMSGSVEMIHQHLLNKGEK